MTLFESPVYEWVKALHVVFVIFWMAGLFILPRFFVYHLEAQPGSAEDAAWKERERRLLRIVLTPAMIAAWVFGLLMVFTRPEMLSGQGWLHAKLLLVVLLSGFHGYLAAQVRKFADGGGLRVNRTWRLLNEVPGAAILAIVILVIVKPF